MEKTIQNTNLARISQFLLILILTSSFFGEKNLFSSYNKYFIEILDWFTNTNVLFQLIIKENMIIALTGLLIIANESNHLIRLILHRIKVEPIKRENEKKVDGNVVDEIELYRGKIIGIIERSIIFIFTITGNFSSIGFILAAKGFTRFKELNKREFAEYVLIGTLLSTCITIFIGILFNNAFTIL